MKRMKKILAILFSSIVVCGACMCLTGCGLRLYESDFFIYTIGYESNEIGILGLTDLGKEQEYLVIPEKIGNRRVRSLGFDVNYYFDDIEEKYGDKKYGLMQSQKLKKIFVSSQCRIRRYGRTGPFYDCPNFEGCFILGGEDIDLEYYFKNWYIDDVTFYATFGKVAEYSAVKTANVSYLYNYENPYEHAPNDGYYWIDNYNYGERIEYIPEAPVREGYTFGGWYKEAECINAWDFATDVLPEAQYNGEEAVYQETRLYAKWIA